MSGRGAREPAGSAPTAAEMGWLGSLIIRSYNAASGTGWHSPSKLSVKYSAGR